MSLKAFKPYQFHHTVHATLTRIKSILATEETGLTVTTQILSFGIATQHPTSRRTSEVIYILYP